MPTNTNVRVTLGFFIDKQTTSTNALLMCNLTLICAADSKSVVMNINFTLPGTGFQLAVKN